MKSEETNIGIGKGCKVVNFHVKLGDGSYFNWKGIKLKGTDNPTGYFIGYLKNIKLSNIKPTRWQIFLMFLNGFLWKKL